MSKPRNFIDTNILVYADACDEGEKQAKAIQIIKENLLDKTGVISTQILQEYSNVALRKLGLAPKIIRERVKFYSNFELVLISPQIILSALEINENRKIGFFDGLVVQTAILSGCDKLLSEDLQNGAIFASLEIVNPFA